MGTLTDQPVMQTIGEDANDCSTVTVSCTTPNVGDDILFFWSDAGADRGTSSDVTTVVRTLTCDANADLISTEGGLSGVVDSVECKTV
uniref:Ig-like domain-containing protein n=1 Tax=Panagrolaimus sp. PS1159 TaxID=55785 RepID=A0AC35F3U3_9BILA